MSSIINILVTHLMERSSVEHAWSEHSLVISLLIISIDRSQLLVYLLWNILNIHEVLLHEIFLLNLAILLIKVIGMSPFRMILRLYSLHLCIDLHLLGLLLHIK